MTRGISGSAAAESGSLTNENVSAFVNNSGEFELTTAGGEQLTYPRANTSGLTVRVDGTNYVIGTPPGRRMDQYRTQDTTFSDGMTTATTRWELPENITIVQRISLAGEAVEFDLSVENTGNQPRDVKIRYLFDYQVGPQDGAPVFINGEVLVSETRYRSPSFDSWLTYDQLPDPSLTGEGTVGTFLTRSNSSSGRTPPAAVTPTTILIRTRTSTRRGKPTARKAIALGCCIMIWEQ